MVSPLATHMGHELESIISLETTYTLHGKPRPENQDDEGINKMIESGHISRSPFSAVNTKCCVASLRLATRRLQKKS